MNNANNEIIPSIYVGTYSKYNNGSIEGAWLPLDDFIDKQEFLTACRTLHKDEHDPELMFQDCEGVPAALFGESWVSSAMWGFMAHEGSMAAKTAFIDCFGEWDAGKFDARYQGEHKSDLDFTYDYIDSCGVLDGVAEHIKRYFNYGAFSRDLFMGDYVSFDGHVFINS